MSVTVMKMALPRLAAALRNGANANGDWGRIAAVELLIGHESWLHRAGFREFVKLQRDGSAWLDLAEVALRVDTTRASSSEAAILRLACSLAGAAAAPNYDTASAWTLRSILQPLGEYNAALAVEAVRYAARGPQPAQHGSAALGEGVES